MPFVALQGRPLQSATIGYAITPNPVRPQKNASLKNGRECTSRLLHEPAFPPSLAKRLYEVLYQMGDYFTTYFLPFLMSTPLAFLPTRWPERL